MFFAVQEPGIRSGLGPVFPSLLAASTWKAGNDTACAARCELALAGRAKLRPIQGWRGGCDCSPYRESGAVRVAQA